MGNNFMNCAASDFIIYTCMTLLISCFIFKIIIDINQNNGLRIFVLIQNKREVKLVECSTVLHFKFNFRKFILINENYSKNNF